MSQPKASRGFVYIHRSIIQWQWYHDHATTRLFIHLIILATHAPISIGGRDIQRGQVITGLYSLSDQTSLSIQQIRTCFLKLKSTRDITIESTNKYSIITICNYERYQFNNPRNNTNINTPSNNQTTNEQQHTITKEHNKKDIVEQARPIIDHLNGKAKTSFRADTVNTCHLISKLMNKGYTQKDFEIVHNKKISEWIDSDRMRKFIRPQTLYAESNFEAYLNEKPATAVSRIAKL